MCTLKYTQHLVFISIFMLLVIPLAVFGHGLGASYEEVVDGYIIDIGYEPEVVTSESRVRFDFGISRDNTGEEVEYSDVWIRINEGTQTVFATGIHRPEFGGAGLLYTFPEEGDYEISARFQNGSEQLAEVVFPIDVIGIVEDSTTSPSSLVLVGLISLLVGGLVSFILMRRKNA